MNTTARLALTCLCAFPLSVAALSGCSAPVYCTLEARASVQVTVVDDAGAAVSGATVTMTPAGKTVTACDASAGGAANAFVCGFEVSGDIAVHAAATGFTPADKTVNVAETPDGCHVVTQQITMTLAHL